MSGGLLTSKPMPPDTLTCPAASAFFLDCTGGGGHREPNPMNNTESNMAGGAEGMLEVSTAPGSRESCANGILLLISCVSVAPPGATLIDHDVVKAADGLAGSD